MKNNITKILLAIGLLVMIDQSLLSQVVIGINTPPQYGTILELKNKQAGTVINVDDDTNITSTNGGLLLPRVKLIDTDLASLNAVVVDGDALSNENKLKLTGLVVYNINSNLDLGLYVWNGSIWARVLNEKITNKMSIKKQPKAFTFYETGLETPEKLTFDVAAPSVSDGTHLPVTYQWYTLAGKNTNAPIITIIPGATSIDYIPADAFKTTNSTTSTLYAQNNGLHKFFCIATASDGTFLKSNIAEVVLGCGAKNNLGEWISFMCFNLGAQKDMKIEKQLDSVMPTYSYQTSGLHTYVSGEQNFWGDLYQWGRITDGHEKRDSPTYARSSLNINSDITSGTRCETRGVGHPYFQISNSSSAKSKFITVTTAETPFNWNPISDLDVLNELWRNTRFLANDPCAHFLLGTASQPNGTYQDYWNNNVDDPTSAACLNEGTSWRLPLQSEWGSIYKDGFISGSTDNATANTWTNFFEEGGTTNLTRNRGLEIKPDGSTTTLLLPFAGNRRNLNGLLYHQGAFGQYWSSTTIGDLSYNLYILLGQVNTANIGSRSIGASVRCTKDN